MKNLYSSITVYFSAYNEKFELINTVLLSLGISLLLVFMDAGNFLTLYFIEIFKNYRYIYSLFPVFVVAIVVTGIMMFFKYRIHRMFRQPLLNLLDKLFVMTFFISVFCILFKKIGYRNITPNFSQIFCIIVLSSIAIVVRSLVIGVKDAYDESSIIDLKDILQGNVDYSKRVVIRENAVNYDLMHWDKLIESLANWIKDYQSEERFVIAIEGKWGSGKSTLISNLTKSVAEDNSIIVIDDFDPWLSEEKSVLLNNLLRSLLVRSGLDIPTNEIDSLIIETSKMILGEEKISALSKILSKNDTNKAKHTVSEINHLLRSKNKKIVLVIDNLDRLLPENIFLILNVVQNFLLFDNLIIVLSYDQSELTKSLSAIKISPDYLKKLVQWKITIPVANKDRLLNVYRKSLLEIFRGKKIELPDKRFDSFLKILIDNHVEIREFKRLLNSVILPMELAKNYKSVFDTVVINTISFLDAGLFAEIYKNSTFYISLDKEWTMNSLSINAKREEDRFNNYFNSLKKRLTDKNSEYELDLLALIFPMVDNFLKKSKSDSRGYVQYKNVTSWDNRNIEYARAQSEKLIFSGKYFPLYFNLDRNLDSILVDRVTEYIRNTNGDPESTDQRIKEVLEFPPEEQRPFFMDMCTLIRKFEGRALVKTINAILDNYFIFSKDLQQNFWSFIRGSWLIETISRGLNEVQFEDAEKIIRLYTSNLKYFRAMSEVKIRLKKLSLIDDDKVYMLIKNQLQYQKQKILQDTSGLNLYDKRVYTNNNVFALLWALEDESDKNLMFKNYVTNCINDSTVYRVLNDMVTVSFSDGIFYHMEKEFENLVDVERLNHYIKCNEPTNVKQEFIKKVYEKYLLGKKNNTSVVTEVDEDHYMELITMD